MAGSSVNSTHTQQSQILAQNRDFCLPHLHSTPSLGWIPSENCYAVWYGKSRTVRLPDREKNFDYMFIGFYRMYERDGQTDGRTDRQRVMAQAALA